MMLGQAGRRVAALVLLLAAAASLGACALVLGGAAIGGVLVATDRRSVGMQVEDDAIERRVNSALRERFARESVYVDVTSYNRKVLLAGQVPSEADRTDAEALATRAENVKQVVNELTIGSLAGLSDRSNDALLSGSVRKALLQAEGVPSGVVKVTTTDASVYLLGRVSPAEGEAAARAASRVTGVKRVVKLFEWLSEEEIERLKRQAQEAPPPESKRATP